MKIPKKFTEEKIVLLKEIYPNSDKNTILNSFPEYKWGNLQNIAGLLKIKREFSEKRKGNIEILFNETLESFYWLGLIVTDGYVSKTGELKVDLCINDKDYLNNLAIFLNSEIKVYPPYKNSKPNSKGICRVKIKDIKNGEKLRKLLEIENLKSYNPISIDFIKKDEQLISFLGGYIDGDGSINEKGIISIDAHENYYEFMYKFGDLLKSKGIVNKFNVLKYKKMCRLTFDVKSSINIKNHLINYKLPIMKRKWDKLNYFIPRSNKLIENKDKILSLKNEGKTLKEICEIINYKSKGTLSCFIKNNLVSL